MSRRVLKIDDEAIQRDVESHQSGSMFHKLQEGANYLRVLPPLEGLVSTTDDGYATYYGLAHQHGMKIDGGFRSIRCPEDKGGWCPFCTMAEYFKMQGDEDSKKRARACFSSAKYFLNAILGKLQEHPKDKSRKRIVSREDKGIVIVQLSNSLFKKVDEHRHGEWGDFTSPDRGYWLNIHGTGSGDARRYPNVTPSRFSGGKLPKWVDFDDAHSLIGDALIPTKKTSEMVMIMIDRYSDALDVEGILRKGQRKHKQKKGRRS